MATKVTFTKKEMDALKELISAEQVLIPGTLFEFNRMVADELKQRIGGGYANHDTGKSKKPWSTETMVEGCKFICHNCKTEFIYHKAKPHKCPVIIDAEFVDDTPQLPSGKE